jgi:putative DNA primase/helicase
VNACVRCGSSEGELAPAEGVEGLLCEKCFAGRNGDSPDADPSTLTDFTEVIAKPVRWVWRHRIAQGKITGLAGRPKVGKGLLYSELIARVTRGELDGDLDGPRNVIIVTTEDEPGDTLKPRLMAAGADLSRVFFFQMGSTEEPVPFRIPQDAEELHRRVGEKDAALVVVDPLIEFVDGKTDSHKSGPVRQAIASLNAIARSSGCAILAVIHLNKSASVDPLARHEASAAFTQVLRGTMLLGRDPADPDGEHGDQRVLAVTSSNLAREAPSLAYRIETRIVDGDTGELIETARMEHIGESTADGADLLGALDDDERGDRDEATEFLRAELAKGSAPAKRIRSAAEGAGIGPWPLKRAKKSLRVRSRKDGIDGGWVWELPEGDAPEPTSQNPSPSSPSASRAKSEAPKGNGNPEGDASQDVAPLRLTTDAEEAEVERIAAKFRGMS